MLSGFHTEADECSKKHNQKRIKRQIYLQLPGFVCCGSNRVSPISKKSLCNSNTDPIKQSLVLCPGCVTNHKKVYEPERDVSSKKKDVVCDNLTNKHSTKHQVQIL